MTKPVGNYSNICLPKTLDNTHRITLNGLRFQPDSEDNTNKVLQIENISGEVNLVNVGDNITFPDGTVLLPSITFTNDLDTGFYRIGDDHLGMTVGGVDKLNISTSLITTSTPINGPLGSAANATFCFGGDPNTGMFSSGQNIINFAAASSSRMIMSPTVLVTTIPINGPLGSASVPTYSFNGDSNTGMYSSADNVINFTAGSSSRMSIDPINVITKVRIRNQVGSLGFPAYSFETDSNTGIWRPQSGEMGFVSDGVSKMLVNNSGVFIEDRIFLPNGNINFPSLSFTNQQDMGISRGGADRFNFIADSQVIFGVTLDRFEISNGIEMAFARATGSFGQMNIFADDIVNTDFHIQSQGGNGQILLESHSIRVQTVPNTNEEAFMITNSSDTVTYMQCDTKNDELTTTMVILEIDGDEKAPSYSFTNSPTTGMYSTAVDVIDFTISNSDTVQINADVVSSNVPICVPNYTVNNLPTTNIVAGCMAYVTNSLNGAVPCYYDNTNWRYFSDDVIVTT